MTKKMILLRSAAIVLGAIGCQVIGDLKLVIGVLMLITAHAIFCYS